MTKTVKIIIIVLTVMVIAGLSGTVVYLLMNEKASGDSTATDAGVATTGGAFVITEDNAGEAADMLQKAKDNSIAVKMTGTWTFNKDCTSSNAYVANSSYNKYPLRVTVNMADTGEELFTLPDMEVGQCAENFGLPNKLEPGEYDAIIMHQSVKDGEIYGTVNTALKIVVQEK